MSRTDKDIPLWVHHNRRIGEATHQEHHSFGHHVSGECTIDEPFTSGENFSYGNRCVRVNSDHPFTYLYGPNITRKHYQSLWYGPERTRTRDELREAVKAYNSASSDEREEWAEEFDFFSPQVPGDYVIWFW